MTNNEIENLLNRLSEQVSELKSSLPQEMPIRLSNSIHLSRAIFFREACLWRIKDLADGAYDMFKKKNVIAAFILCRSFMETEALFWHFFELLDDAIKSNGLDRILIFMTRALVGIKGEAIKKFANSNDVTNVPTPLNILTLVDKMKMEGYSVHFESLCEFSHPNAAGTINSYVKLNWDSNTAYFGTDKTELSELLALPHLVHSLEAFINLYNLSAELLEQFYDLCERHYSVELVQEEKKS